MIKLHRLHGNGEFVVNADLIETIEACPDTVVTLVTKRRYVVTDSVHDVIDRVIAFRRAGAAGPDVIGVRALQAVDTADEAAS